MRSLPHNSTTQVVTPTPYQDERSACVTMSRDVRHKGANLIERQQAEVRYLQFNHYLQFPDMLHAVFMRHGGCSAAPYHFLNTSTSIYGSGDSIDTVIHNRQIVLNALDMQGFPCATLWQVHGADIAVLENLENWRTDWAYPSYYRQSWKPQEIHKADALITKQRGVSLVLSFADCVPVLLYDAVQQVIGLAHGGWRGTARGIAAATVDGMKLRFGCRPRDIYVGVGPSIGPCCYEVSEAVRQLFLGQVEFEHAPPQAQYRDLVREAAAFSLLSLSDKDSLRLDLEETNRRQLLMAGILPEHLETAHICTSCSVEHFFSHRRERAKTGRFPVIIALR